MAVLVIAEHDNQALKGATLNTVAAAQALGEVHLLVAGHRCQSVVSAAARIPAVAKVIHADDAAAEHGLVEHLAPLAAAAVRTGGYSHVLAPATAFGKSLLPRVAALLDVAQVSDVVEIIAPDIFVRPIYAGNALATVQSLDAVKVLTVRTTAFAPVRAEGGDAPVEALGPVPALGLSRFVSSALTASTRPELTAARVIVSGGRGLGAKENFVLIEQLADTLDAAVGASRAAVDAGFAPNDCQVGQTGKVVAPELYIAVGISGAIQHLAGMKDSKTIVAINKDPEAPIFQVADVGLVGDLFALVPELTAALS